MNIPVCIPVVPANARRYVESVIERNWVSSLCLDPEVNYIKKLEEGFSAFVGAKFGCAVTSGTTALDLAVAALGIGPGDEVIVPSFTMIASASCVVHNGATPVFVDSDPNTWCIDVGLIEKAITEKTRAIIPVHIYGYPCDMDKILNLAQRHNLYVIEDAAQAIGTGLNGKYAGSIGHLGCFSFYANKTMTSGEGGMVVTSDEALAKRNAMLKDQAFGEPRFIHEEIGFNFRMNNLTAAYAFAAFEEVDRNINKKVENAASYNAALEGIEGVTLPPKTVGRMKNSYWMYGILIDPQRYGRKKAETRDLLKREYGIDTRDFFYPMHRQPAMTKRGYVEEGTRIPVSEMLWERGFYLPSSTNLTQEQIAYIADALRKIRR